jgi:hypothetical protein
MEIVESNITVRNSSNPDVTGRLFYLDFAWQAEETNLLTRKDAEDLVFALQTALYQTREAGNHGA